MMPFSVEVEGVSKEGQGNWVLAVDPASDQVLLAHQDKSLHWHPMAECTFHGMCPPGAPQPVFVVQPQQQGPGPGPSLLVPNRQMRRHPPDNGA
jgi:hypothetical protein